LSRPGLLLARKMGNEQFDFVAKTVEIGRDGGGLESIWMCGCVTNDCNNPNRANQDRWQSVRKVIDGLMKPATSCLVMHAKQLLDDVRASDDLANDGVDVGFFGAHAG